MGGLMMIVSGDDEDVAATTQSGENENAMAEGERRLVGLCLYLFSMIRIGPLICSWCLGIYGGRMYL